MPFFLSLKWGRGGQVNFSSAMKKNHPFLGINNELGLK